jgi:hypothetical protein
MPREIAVIFFAQDDRVVPVDLVEAIAWLEQSGIRHKLYMPARGKRGSWRQAVAETLSGVQADEVFVCFLNENHYLATASLLQLVFCAEFLGDRDIHVCLPALSLFRGRPALRGRFVWHAKKLTQVLGERLDGLKKERLFSPEVLADVTVRLGYRRQILSALWSPGCGHSCSFCFSRDNGEMIEPDAGIRQEKLVFLLELARLTEASCFKFRDPDFLGVPANAWEALRILGSVAPGTAFRCNARLEDLNREALVRLADAGCSQVFSGVEHVSMRLVEATGKQEKVLGLLAGVLAHKPRKMDLALSFLAGLPGETLPEAKDNLCLIRKLMKLKGVKPYLGYYVLFAQEVRSGAFFDPLLACLNFSAIVPEGMFLDYQDYCGLLKTVREDAFFSFFAAALNRNSAEVIRMLLREFSADACLSECMPMARKLLLLRPELANRIMSELGAPTFLCRGAV